MHSVENACNSHRDRHAIHYTLEMITPLLHSTFTAPTQQYQVSFS